MIPLFKPYMPQDIINDVETVLYSGNLAFGTYGRSFEKELGQYLGTPNVVVVNSYGSALELLLNVHQISPGDEVIMSPMGCLRSTQPMACRNAQVIWADIDPETGTLSPENVKKKITTKTRLIINYHHLGYVGYCDELNALGKKYGIPVIEDCLDGIGGCYKGKKVGVCCDAAVISFDAVRLPNAIEGGALVFQDAKLAELARLKRDLGVDRGHYRDEYNEINPGCDISVTGYACTMNNVNALIALRQLPELDRLLAQRRQNAEKWKELLAARKDCIPLKKICGSTPNYWVFGLLADNRQELFMEFRAQGIGVSSVHFPNNHYSVFHNSEYLPGVEEFQKRFLALPTPAWTDV